MQFHFLHIRKTGGTAIKAAVKGYAKRTGDIRIVTHAHRVTMAEALASGADAKVFFVVRDPVSRFVSGFNSRLREGRPRRNAMWNEAEAGAFTRFQTPDMLAVALGRPGEEGEAARKAIGGIRHTSSYLSTWLVSPDYLEAHRDRIAFVGMTPELDRDIDRLRRAIGVTEEFQLPSDALNRHETPDGFQTAISPEAEANVRDWYAGDVAILEWCKAFREQMM